MRSFIAHAEIARSSVVKEPPPQQKIERALAIMEKTLASVKWHIPDDFLSFERFLWAVTRLDNSSSPGFPYKNCAPTIGSYLGFDGVWYDEFKLQSLWYDVCRLIDGDFEDVLYSVFIKDEPHKEAKISSNRWRLIVSSPLNVQVFWHMMFAEMNDNIIRDSFQLPCQQGIILNAGGWRMYRGQWLQKGLNMGLDKRAWDWTVPGWKIQMALDLRMRLVYGKCKGEWIKHAQRLYDSMFRDCKLLFSNGEVWKQCFYGVMKSGCVNTISDNTNMQVTDHILACDMLDIDYEPLPVACGDDTLQKKEQVLDLSPYEKLGAVVKSASEGLEFVGNDFSELGPQPLYFEKHVFKIPYLKSEVLPDYMDAMMRMYAYSPLFDFWENLAIKLGVAEHVRSREYYVAWFEYQLD